MMNYGESLKKFLEKEPKFWHFQKGTFFPDHPLYWDWEFGQGIDHRGLGIIDRGFVDSGWKFGLGIEIGTWDYDWDF